MTYYFLLAAATLSFAGAVFHGAIGGRIYYMQNIKSSNLEPLTQSLSLASWHIFTVFLVVGSGTLLYVAHNPAFMIAAYPLIVINALGATLFIFLALIGHAKLLRLPGAYLMAGTAILTWLGLGLGVR